MGNVADLALPGTSGNYVSTPDSAGLSVTGDIDIRVKLNPTTWNPPSAAFALASKFSNSAGQRSYRFYLGNGGGSLIWDWSPDGSTLIGGFGVCQSSVAPRTIFADGTAGWVRVTFEVNVGGAWRCIFYTSPDGTTWTQLGATRTGAAASSTSIFDSNAKVALGTDREVGTQLLWAGKLHKVEIRNGVGGTVVGTFDATTVTKTATRTPTTLSDAQGNTWTVNGSAWDWDANPSVTGSGGLTATPATLSGTGTSTTTGVGGLSAVPATLSGTGSLLDGGGGSLATQPASLAGAGSLLIGGDGALLALPGGLSSSGGLVLGGDGTLVSAAATLEVDGGLALGGDGDLLAAAGVLAGLGVALVSGGGLLAAQAGVLSGSGAVLAGGDGALLAVAAALSTLGDLSLVGDGALTSAEASLSATGSIFDTRVFHDVVFTLGALSGHPLTLGNPSAHPLEIGHPSRHRLTLGAP